MATPVFLFLDSNSPFKDLFLPRGPNLAQNPLDLVGTVLKSVIWQANDFPLSWEFQRGDTEQVIQLM